MREIEEKSGLVTQKDYERMKDGIKQAYEFLEYQLHTIVDRLRERQGTVKREHEMQIEQ